MATTIEYKPIGSVFAVRSLLLLLLLNGAPTEASEDDLDTRFILDMVNGIRSTVSPSASDMHYLAFSSDFKAKAKKLAEKCEVSLPEPGVVYFIVSSHSTLGEVARQIIKDGEENTRNGRCKNVASSRVYLSCRFYRDLMEAGADRIGCDLADCSRHNIGWLHYCVTNARNSNKPFTDLVYKRGTPCHMCPATSGYCYHNLCVSHATKTAIQRETPSAIITCDAPCVNCGERKDANNACFCQCPRGYNSEVDCSKGSGSLTCSACGLAGTPCRNGGREVGGLSGLCRCLCNGDYGGQFCEIPMAQIVGGVVASLRYDSFGFFPFRNADLAAEKFKERMVGGINMFCRENQANYLECCGSGTLPNSGPMDFVDASSVCVTSPVLLAKQTYNMAICTVYASAKGNNGLCRKRTSIPPPILAVPPSVVKKVIKIADKNIGWSVTIGAALNYYADYYNVSIPIMNYLSLNVG